jgi:hypothetical protein
MPGPVDGKSLLFLALFEPLTWPTLLLNLQEVSCCCIWQQIMLATKSTLALQEVSHQSLCPSEVFSILHLMQNVCCYCHWFLFKLADQVTLWLCSL